MRINHPMYNWYKELRRPPGRANISLNGNLPSPYYSPHTLVLCLFDGPCADPGCMTHLAAEDVDWLIDVLSEWKRGREIDLARKEEKSG